MSASTRAVWKEHPAPEEPSRATWAKLFLSWELKGVKEGIGKKKKNVYEGDAKAERVLKMSQDSQSSIWICCSPWVQPTD